MFSGEIQLLFEQWIICCNNRDVGLSLKATCQQFAFIHLSRRPCLVPGRAQSKSLDRVEAANKYFHKRFKRFNLVLHDSAVKVELLYLFPQNNHLHVIICTKGTWWQLSWQLRQLCKGRCLDTLTVQFTFHRNLGN